MSAILKNKRILTVVQEATISNSPLIIASDIHGSLEALEALIDAAKAHRSAALLFAGDLCPTDDPRFRTLLSALPTHLVSGNCDSSYGFSAAGIPYPPRFLLTESFGRKILLTHGDFPFSALDFGLEAGDIIATGHTHVPHLYTDSEGMIQVNGGSVARPRSESGPTYALLFANRLAIHRLRDRRSLLSLAIKS
ncbi:MAG TPA: metallophosphoesterase family protein [Sphaerochaeta sp.]|nr:metallophosphoesterase family protein [Sphaerochaeta sp.]